MAARKKKTEAPKSLLEAAQMAQKSENAQPIETVRRLLLCKLSHEELEDCGKKLAARVAEIDVNDEEKKASAKMYADRGKRLNEEARKLGRTIKSEQEERMVDCAWFIDGLHVKCVRLDTQEEIQRRAMTAHEKQLSLRVEGRSILADILSREPIVDEESDDEQEDEEDDENDDSENKNKDDKAPGSSPSAPPAAASDKLNWSDDDEDGGDDSDDEDDA